MLWKVDLSHPVLYHYLTTINPVVQVWVLFPKVVKGTSKVFKVSRKSNNLEKPKPIPVQTEKEVSKSVRKQVDKEVLKEVISKNMGILKRTKKPTHHPRLSPEPPIIDDVSDEPLASPKKRFFSKIW